MGDNGFVGYFLPGGGIKECGIDRVKLRDKEIHKEMEKRNVTYVEIAKDSKFLLGLEEILDRGK